MVLKISYSISGFKMFKKTPYELPDVRVFIRMIRSGIKINEELYGQAYTSTVIKYALRAVAKLTGETPPQDIKTLEQLEDCLVSKLDALRAMYIIIWAQFVTIKKLEGSLGVGHRFLDMGIFKNVMENTKGKVRLVKHIGRDRDMRNVLSALHSAIFKMGVCPHEMGYKKNADGSIDVLYRNCYLQDGCQMSLDSNLNKRPDGRQVCGFSAYVCQYLKMATGRDWDYTITVFNKPICLTKCFMA